MPKKAESGFHCEDTNEGLSKYVVYSWLSKTRLVGFLFVLCLPLASIGITVHPPLLDNEPTTGTSKWQTKGSDDLQVHASHSSCGSVQIDVPRVIWLSLRW